jgi:hypothetical protein
LADIVVQNSNRIRGVARRLRGDEQSHRGLDVTGFTV